MLPTHIVDVRIWSCQHTVRIWSCLYKDTTQKYGTDSSIVMEITATLDTSAGYGVLDATFVNFSTLPNAVGNITQTEPVELGKYKWIITIYPGGVDLPGYLSLYLRNANGAAVEVDATYSILSETRAAISARSPHGKLTKEEVLFGYKKFVTLEDLNNPVKGLLANDNLRVRITIHRVTGEQSTLGIMSDSHFLYRGGLSTPPRESYETVTEAILTDALVLAPFTAEASHRKGFPVHKYVLALHSPVFRAMFKNHMREAATNTIEISDFPEPVVHAFVRFLYEDRCAKCTLQEHATQLLMMADKYQVAALVEVCEHYLTSTLTAENVCGLLGLAESHNAQGIRASAIAFMRDHLKAVVATPDCAQLSAAVLLDLLRAVAENKS